MAVSPDDRFAGLINSSAERGGWVPGDVFTADSEGEEEPVAPRRIRLPVLVALALATVAVLLLALYVFRPAEQHDPATGDVDSAGEAGAAGNRADSNAGGIGEAGAGADGATADPSASNRVDDAEGGMNAEVIVHVTGAVNSPSVVTLGAGARVQDAVEAAGGLQSDAEPDSINLARVVQDGEQIHIPAEGEEPAAKGDAAEGSAGDGADASGTASGTGTSPGPGTGGGGKIDLNTADAAALQTLPGVGPVTAEAIIAHRQTQPFGSVDDLLLVKGIGPKTFDSLKDLVSVG